MHAVRKLFNSNTQPKYHFKPLPPFAYNYDEYIHQCANNGPAELKDYFSRCFKGKVVQWQGIIVHVDKKYIGVQCNPTDIDFSVMDCKLFLPKEAQKHYNTMFTENQSITFKAQLVDYGTTSPHELNLILDDTVTATPGLTYEYFLSIFGRKAQISQDVYHSTIWKGKTIELRGHFCDVISLLLSTSKNGQALFKLSNGFTKSRQETIEVFFPLDVPEMFTVAKRSKSSDEFRILAEVHERNGMTHTFFVRLMVGPTGSPQPVRLGKPKYVFPEEARAAAPPAALAVSAVPQQIPPPVPPQSVGQDLQKYGQPYPQGYPPQPSYAPPGQPQYYQPQQPQPYPPQQPMYSPQQQIPQPSQQPYAQQPYAQQTPPMGAPGYPQQAYAQQYPPQYPPQGYSSSGQLLTQSQYNPADPTFAPPPEPMGGSQGIAGSGVIVTKDEGIPSTLPSQGFQQQPHHTPQAAVSPSATMPGGYDSYPSVPTIE
ncbi:hypothetical protein BLNAU_13659 [Blattamonas nauphoetae]|uniref:Uncharacterized protein n=1 Tax=Blattamonas nauphoetae TaxID=2049346 RepID=A0ABQ9XI43_9EUKA|nr:hypothetical protein BLNAU_13659 [Blattamonas nauphoetae]